MKTDRRIIIVPDFMIVFKTLDEAVDQSLNDIHLKTTITYSHLHHIKKIFLEKEWITAEKDGRRFKLNLTEKGHKIVDTIYLMFKELDINNENLKEYRQRTKHKVKEEVVKPVEETVVEEPVVEEPIEETVAKETVEETVVEEPTNEDDTSG